MAEQEPIGVLVIRSAVPGVDDVVIRMNLDSMRQLARAALHRVRELEIAKGCPRARCGMCGEKVRVG